MGEEIEVAATQPAKEDYRISQLEGNSIDQNRVVDEFSDVFPDELLGMPPEWDITVYSYS